ncbi:hypothetical protein [Candidatus Frankia alpina]|uniref:hypothetical protein n=1 Tax=Candidatus Frankia alpina TaxID=2699483 RepID=UPI001F209B59|nr:hypothetical protein [Candidatus Frankia alpina]
MAIYFAGGLVGSIASGTAYSHGDWVAVSVTGAVFGLAAVALACWDALRRDPAAAAV